MNREKEPADPAEEAMAAERSALGRLIRFHSLSSLSGRLLRAHNRVGRFVNGSRDISQHEKLVVLTSAGISPWLHYDLLRASLPELQPAEILRQLCRDPAHVCAEPFLLELEQKLKVLRLKAVGDGAGADGFQAQLAEIEELRNLSIALAREQLSSLILKMLEQADRSRMPARSLVGELALAIGAWAGLSWRDRRFYDSCDAYCLAFELATVDGSKGLLIQLKQRAAHLIADSSFMDYAKVWLREAVDFYFGAGEAEGQGKALVDLGRITFLSGQIEAATQCFEKALPLLSPENFRYRVAALEALSNCYQDCDDLDKATVTLEQAYLEYGDRRDSYRGYLAWVRARLCGQAGADAEAERHFSEAVELLHRFGGTLAAELALLDFSDFRVRAGKSTKDIGQLVMTWLKETRYDAKEAQIAAKLVSALLWGNPTSDSIAGLRRSIELAGGVTCPPRLKNI